MDRKVKIYDKRFKSQVALAAYKGDKSLLEISIEYDVPKTNIRDWLDKLKTNIYLIFDNNNQGRDKELVVKNKQIEELHKVIGQITVENTWLKKKLEN